MVIPRAIILPWLATPAMIEGHSKIWNSAHTGNYPWLPFNVDPLAPGLKPERTTPMQSSPGITQEALLANDEIKATAELFDANLGVKSNETSGVAIEARAKRGSNANFEYSDNLTRAQVYSGKVILDLIPHIYDTSRIIKIRGEDESEKFIAINYANGEDDEILNDFSVGKYAVRIKSGPSFATQRIETAETMLAFIKVYPDAAPLIGDLLAKNMDWKDADVVSKRLVTLMPPEAREVVAGESGVMDDDEQGQVEEEQPDPMEVLEVQKAQLEIEGVELDNKKTEVEIEKILTEITAASTKSKLEKTEAAAGGGG